MAYPNPLMHGEVSRASRLPPRAAARALEPALWPQSIAAPDARLSSRDRVRKERARCGRGVGVAGWGLVLPARRHEWDLGVGIWDLGLSPCRPSSTPPVLPRSAPACLLAPTSLIRFRDGTEAAAKTANPRKGLVKAVDIASDPRPRMMPIFLPASLARRLTPLSAAYP